MTKKFSQSIGILALLALLSACGREGEVTEQGQYETSPVGYVHEADNKALGATVTNNPLFKDESGTNPLYKGNR